MKTPNPNKAKSYFTGSIGTNFRRDDSNFNNALASFSFLFHNPKLHIT